MTHLDEKALAAKAWADLEFAASATRALEVANVTLPIEKVRALVAERPALPSSPVSELVDRLRGTAEWLTNFAGRTTIDHARPCTNGAIALSTLSTRNADLEREVKRLREAQQWQPIETAPQSVDILVGGYLNDEWKCSVYRIRDEFWREDWGAEPTHWQPLSISPHGGEYE